MKSPRSTYLLRNPLTLFLNTLFFLNKISTSTTLEDIEQAFIYRDVSIKNLKRNVKAHASPITLVTFLSVSGSDKTEILKTGLVVKNEKKPTKDYINRDKLVYKCFTCKKNWSSDQTLQVKSKPLSQI